MHLGEITGWTSVVLGQLVSWPQVMKLRRERGDGVSGGFVLDRARVDVALPRARRSDRRPGLDGLRAAVPDPERGHRGDARAPPARWGNPRRSWVPSEAVDDEANHFDERVAASYDESSADEFRPVGRRSDRRLPRRARRERACARARDRDRADRAPARAARRAGARDRAVEGHGRAAAREAGRRRHRRHDRRLRDDHGGRVVLARVPRLQHDHEPDDAGGAGRVLPQRGGAPRTGRALRHRGDGPGAAAAPARRDLPRLRRPARATGGSTSTTSRTRGSSRTTSRSWTATLERVSVPFRYVWPAELDLMAELAGMTLRERWSGWKREPFTSDSRQHVSVWKKGER